MNDFAAFAESRGLVIRSLFPSDRIQRCGVTDKPKSKNGAYLWDGQRGWVMRWDEDATPHWFGGEPKEFTEAERAAWAARRRVVEREQVRGWTLAAVKAAAMISECKIDTHNYLYLKGFPDEKGLVTKEGELCIPMRHFQTDALRGLQRIRWLMDDRRWEKKMIFGMRAEGAVLRLGPRQTALSVFCEGYATGLSIRAAIDALRIPAAVWVCFSWANIVYVAQKVGGRRGVFADHDLPKNGETMGKGEYAAREVGLPFVMSPEPGEDANDLHVRAGLMSVQVLILKLVAEM